MRVISASLSAIINKSSNIDVFPIKWKKTKHFSCIEDKLSYRPAELQVKLGLICSVKSMWKDRLRNYKNHFTDFFRYTKISFCWEINANNQNPLKWSFEALNYDMVLKASRSKTDYVIVFKTAQPSFTTSKYLLKWFGENCSVLCIQNTVADTGEGPPLIFRPNWGPKGRKSFLETASRLI